MSTASPTAAVEAATATVTTYLDIVLPRNTFAVSPSVTVEAASITVIILILPWKIITNSLFSSRFCVSCSRYCNYILYSKCIQKEMEEQCHLYCTVHCTAYNSVIAVKTNGRISEIFFAWNMYIVHFVQYREAQLWKSRCRW